ncbi:MAG: hypothetical protein AABY89_11195, partial [Acidobacteriota bacterium]
MFARLVRLALSVAVLGCYYWNFVVSPVAEPPPPAMRTPASAPAVDEIRLLSGEADVAYKAGRYEAALAPLLDLNRTTPNSAIVIGRLAKTYGHLGRPRDEAQLWEQYLTLSPTPIDACPALPKAYEVQGLADKAFGAYQRCYALDPLNADV